MSGDFYVDDPFVEPVTRDVTSAHMWPRVRRWERWLRWRCRSTEWITTQTATGAMTEMQVRCEKRAGHAGGHDWCGHRWGWATIPDMSRSPHFVEWAQTCPLGEWTVYEGPVGDGRRRIRCDVYMLSRPTLP